VIFLKEYDLIVIGTGSAMNLVEPFLRQNHHAKVAVIDKDEPGGICLTRGCIPSKLILYPAELVRQIEKAKHLNIDVEIKNVDFTGIMKRMRTIINHDIDQIRKGLSSAQELDYYPEVAEFIDDYTLKVGDEVIKSNLIFLCTGSTPHIPQIKNLENIEYHTSRTILQLEEKPESLIIVGGGYIAAEYGHFFSAMGTRVTILGRNPQFLPQEEPEVGKLAEKELSTHMEIHTNHEVIEVNQSTDGRVTVVARNISSDEKKTIIADDILISAGRKSLSDILKPEKSGIEIDEKGWIKVDNHLETSKPGIWAFGDANGKYLFKHAANYESKVVFYNAILKRKMEIDYHAIPSAVFTYPEVASVGLREEEAIEFLGKDKILIGLQRYQDTAKGEAMAAEDYFVKVLVEFDTERILGAHIIGPYASILIQEIINLMYTPNQSLIPITEGMHIHPALNEVVERAFYSLMPVDNYHEYLKHYGLEE